MNEEGIIQSGLLCQKFWGRQEKNIESVDWPTGNMLHTEALIPFKVNY